MPLPWGLSVVQWARDRQQGKDLWSPSQCPLCWKFKREKIGRLEESMFRREVQKAWIWLLGERSPYRPRRSYKYPVPFKPNSCSCEALLCLSNCKAISRRPFSLQQNMAVENFFEQTHSGPKNLIEKYIAGNIQYSLLRSKYGSNACSTTTNIIRNQHSHLSDSSCLFLDPTDQ